MPIYLYGMNHVSAPLDVRERVAFPEGSTGDAVARLLRIASIAEGMILSTCNRTEILAHGDAGAPDDLRRFLCEERGVGEEEIERHCYLHAGRDAVRHLFRVSASLDSMVLGEAQILGQVKEAYAAAGKVGGLGTVLDTLLQRSFSVAKKVRTGTGVARNPVSIAHAAAGLARDIFGDLRDRAILVVGAGKMARLAARHLIGDGVASIVVVNRSYQRGMELARELGGQAVPFDRLFDEMEKADVVIASTAAPDRVVRHEDALVVSRARRGRPLFFIDIAVPRDVDPRVNEIDNVYLYDIDDLQGVVRANLDGRRQEAAAAESIVERESGAFVEWLRALDVAPLIVDLRRQMHRIGAGELERFRRRLALRPEQETIIEEMTTALVNKLLHQPIQAMKRAVAAGGHDRLAILREAFGLGGGEARGGGGAAKDSAESGAAGSDPDGAGAAARAPAATGHEREEG